MMSIARSILTDPELAEEVVQDTFLALWRKPSAFDPRRGSLRSFLCAVARNKAVDRVRREQAQRRVAATLGEAALSLPSVSHTDPDDRITVLHALRSLSPVQREALLLAYFGGRTYRVVASELDIPVGTAKTRMRDGLSSLRTVLATLRPA
jgi:RNA polymerase sigma-70 factor (ECF subfamily)